MFINDKIQFLAEDTVMDNLDNGQIPPSENLDKPIPFDDTDTADANISHSPLNLGAGAKPQTAAQPATPIGKPPAEKIVSTERITGAKTFFTKLHAGAIEFLDEQITNWLKNNPGVTIKKTNTVTGEVAAKKTEPNIIVTIWY